MRRRYWRRRESPQDYQLLRDNSSSLQPPQQLVDCRLDVDSRTQSWRFGNRSLRSDRHAGHVWRGSAVSQ